MTKREGERLLAVGVDGSYRLVPNTYEGIKQGLGGATLDFLSNGGVGLYIDDNGMLEDQPLNVPASLMTGRPLYGPVVLCGPYPDEEGDTLPPSMEASQALVGLCQQWALVWEGAVVLGQDISVHPRPDSLPPAQITSFDSEEEFMTWLEGR